MRVIRFWYCRMGQATAAIATALWMVTLVAACASIAPVMECHGMNLPCCPHSGSSSAECAGVQCGEAIPQKPEARAVVAAQSPHAAAVLEQISEQPSPSPNSELTPGLRFRTAVFRLKGDFRI